MRAFNIEIVTPDGLKFSGEVESLLVRTTEGDVEILAGHTDFLASLATGRARLIIDGKTRVASASGGIQQENKLAKVTFTIPLKKFPIALYHRRIY